MGKAAKKLTPVLEKIIVKVEEWVDWVASPAGGKVIEKFFKRIGKVASMTFKFLGKMWDQHFKKKMEWLLTSEGGAALEKWFTKALDTIELMAKGVKGIAEFIGAIQETLKTDVDRARDISRAAEKAAETQLPGFRKMIARELAVKGEFVHRGVKMEALQANVRPFMRKVTEVETKAFRKRLTDLDIKESLRKQLIRTFKSQLSVYEGLVEPVTAPQSRYGGAGFGTETKKPAKTGEGFRHAAPKVALPSAAAKAARFLGLRPPEVRLEPETKKPTTVAVVAETPTQNKLLSSINNNLDTIARRTGGPKPHASSLTLRKAMG
jgi:hypothetical protein